MTDDLTPPHWGSQAMTEAPELLPCPFCGGTKLSVFPPNCKEDDEYDPKDNAQPIVRCYTCFAEAMGKTWDHGMKSAVAAWNTRTDLIPAMLEAARREAMEEAIKRAMAFIADEIEQRGKNRSVFLFNLYVQELRARAASLSTPTPVDGENSGDAGGKVQDRIQRDDDGDLDEIVASGGAHLERLNDTGWYLSLTQVDGTETRLWFDGRVTMEETTKGGA